MKICTWLVARLVLAASVPTMAAVAPATHQQAFPTPEAGAAALVDGIKRQDRAAMESILGRGYMQALGLDTVPPEDRAAFLAGWEKRHAVRHLGKKMAVVEVGMEGWTLPIPLKRQAAGWRFDVPAGRAELRVRRIGRNELAAMQAALAYYDAQREYALADRTGSGTLTYAQRIISSPGKHDGLYWPTSAGEPQSPLGPLLANHRSSDAYYGYHFRILEKQGGAANGGARDYVVDGKMTNGFALIAWPARYGDSGVMSFIINHDGVIYEKDLGPDSEKEAASITRFDPDRSWKRSRPIPQDGEP